MSTYATRPAAALQASRSKRDADCHHSREPFDCLFATIQERTDIGGNPKRLYALLVSGRRKGVYWTQDELAEMLGSVAVQ